MNCRLTAGVASVRNPLGVRMPQEADCGQKSPYPRNHGVHCDFISRLHDAVPGVRVAKSAEPFALDSEKGW